jgi:hypothetical protein
MFDAPHPFMAFEMLQSKQKDLASNKIYAAPKIRTNLVTFLPLSHLIFCLFFK